MTLTSNLDRMISLVLTTAIAAIAVVVVRREVLRNRPSGPPPPPPTFVSNWEAILAPATRPPRNQLLVRVTEFGDLQCPGCRGYQRILNRIVDRFDGKVEVEFVHFPIEYHDMARTMARGAECSRREGRFAQFVDKVYQAQESIRIKTPYEYAQSAGVSDSVRFHLCIADTTSADIPIDAGLKAGADIGVRATPTILVNGWRFEGAPTEYQLQKFIRETIDGKHPAPGATPPP